MKKFLIVSALFFALAFASVPSFASTTPANSSMQTVWNPVSLTNNYLSDYYIQQGDETVFHGTVSNYTYNAPANVNVSVELYDRNHQRVSQIVEENVTLQPFGHFNVELISPRNLTSGQYYFTVGIYKGDTLIGWYPGYQSFTVHQ